MLYVELLYTVKHKIGAEANSIHVEEQEGQLYEYAQKAFSISDEQHKHLLKVTSMAKVRIYCSLIVIRIIRAP